ncbi:GlcG/HbpS family heme-binding protein [Novosphingobium terrae]|uniref:GlcG/HbpS family heme-binding protein n=1 Tax=Novosphingobium terrae TaxID=2726189 RepID=UPI00197DC0FD|nr:heme-binding protein [Novosphingobium terrae]
MAQSSDPVAALPGQKNPPPLDAMLRPPRSGPAAVEAPYSGPAAPALSAAQAVAQAALQACAAQHLHIGVAVLNSEGSLIAALVDPDAKPGVAYVAVQKAHAALAFGEPTTRVQEQLRADPALRARLTPDMAVYPGGIPWQRDGRIVGAVAASGATAQQDEACLLAGLAQIHDR